MSSQLVISLDSEKLTKKLTQIEQEIGDLRRPFATAGDKLVKSFANDVVEAQGRLSGGAWTPWSTTTIAARERRTGHYSNSPERTDLILVWTGKMRKGFERAVTSTTLIIRNTVDYFKQHQLGGGRVPKRPILTINSAVVDVVVEEVENHIKKLLS